MVISKLFIISILFINTSNIFANESCKNLYDGLFQDFKQYCARPTFRSQEECDTCTKIFDSYKEDKKECGEAYDRKGTFKRNIENSIQKCNDRIKKQESAKENAKEFQLSKECKALSKNIMFEFPAKCRGLRNPNNNKEFFSTQKQCDQCSSFEKKYNEIKKTCGDKFDGSGSFKAQMDGKIQKCNSRIAELNEKKDQFLEDKKNKKREKDCTEIIKKVEKEFRLACEKNQRRNNHCDSCSSFFQDHLKNKERCGRSYDRMGKVEERVKKALGKCDNSITNEVETGKGDKGPDKVEGNSIDAKPLSKRCTRLKKKFNQQVTKSCKTPSSRSKCRKCSRYLKRYEKNIKRCGSQFDESKELKSILDEATKQCPKKYKKRGKKRKYKNRSRRKSIRNSRRKSKRNSRIKYRKNSKRKYRRN